MTAPARSTASESLDEGTCKACEAPILWALTVHGRRVPLDAKPERRFVLSHDVPRVVVQRDVFTPHHMTCPKAADFKAAKAPAAEPGTTPAVDPGATS